MTVRVYKSTDGSAPSLTGQVGSLTALLDAVLVNGYGAKTAAGWSIGFTTTNKRAYLQNLTGSNNTSGMYLYVDDTGPGAGAAREARCCGFETMSAITPTGTGQFPLNGQASALTGGFVGQRKSNTADATARPWVIVANGQSFYLFVETGDNTNPVGCNGFFFGDFKPYKPGGDQYAVGIIGRYLENSANSTQGEFFSAVSIGQSAGPTLSASLMGHFLARTYTGIGSSRRFGVIMDMNKFHYCNTNGNGSGAYISELQNSGTFASVWMGRYNTTGQWQSPNPVDGSMWIQPAYVCHDGVMRGYLPGLWIPLHDRPLNQGDSFTVTSGNLNGKSFLAQSIICSVSSNTQDNGTLFIETSDTWN